MGYETENFELSGPLHLTTIDWNNTDHRRSVAASLVKGCYIQERDRQKKRKGSEALAPPWWQSFNFSLSEQLIDKHGTIFGAVYRYNSPNYSPNDSSPRYVIAFRGTLNKRGSFFHDFRHNVCLIINRLHRRSRSERAMLAVKKIVEEHGGTNNIWLAGHSLGASMAMLAGKYMANSEKLIECFLFNLPFIALPIEGDRTMKSLLRIGRSVFTAVFSVAVNGRQNLEEEDQFGALSAWVPNIFVNKKDFICSEYIGYFKDRERLEGLGAATIGRLSTRCSIVGLITKAVGNKFDPLHLIPSANLTVNLSLQWAHELQQWWEPDVQLRSETYMYPWIAC